MFRFLQEVELSPCVVPHDSLVWIVVLGAIFMVGMGAMIGANDMANVLATSIGSKSLNLLQATFFGVIFIIIGATFLGSRVADTIRSKIVSMEAFEDNPSVLMFGMLCALMGATLWLFTATRLGWPVSTTHSITGALIGVGLAHGKSGSINWDEVLTIVLSWIFSPVLAAVLGGLFFFVVRWLLLRPKNSVKRSYRFLAILLFLISDTFILSFMLQTSIIINVSCPQNTDDGIQSISPCNIEEWMYAQPHYGFLVSVAISLVLTGIFSIFAYPFANRQMKRFEDERNGIVQETKNSVIDNLNMKLYKDVHKESYKESAKAYEMSQKLERFMPETEKFFTVLQVLSAFFDTMALGASDIANTAGPFTSLVNIYQTGTIEAKVNAPLYILFAGGVAIAIGLAVMGYHVIKTLGVKLITVTPSRGFCIEMASAWVILFFTNAGIPLSSTHCQVGSTVGVGLTEKREGSFKNNIFGKGVNWKLFGLICSSWVLTLIVAGGLSAALFSFGVYAPTSFLPSEI